MHVERILADEDHFDNVKPALDYFFEFLLLPHLLTGTTITSQPDRRNTTDKVKNT